MKRKCLKCEKEYQVKLFSFDSGYCDGCKPSFLSFPSIDEFFSFPWRKPKQSTPAETKSLLIAMIGIHIILLLLFSMLLDSGVISIPGMFYFGFATLYLFARLIIWGLSKDGYPSLKVFHRAAIFLMPFYGFPIFILIWLPIRKVIFKD